MLPNFLHVTFGNLEFLGFLFIQLRAECGVFGRSVIPVESKMGAVVPGGRLTWQSFQIAASI